LTTVFFFKVLSSQEFAPHLTFVNSSNSVDCNPCLDFPFKVKPDVSVYSNDLFPGEVTDSAKVELFIEFKWKYDHDPFRAPHTTQHNPNIFTFLRNTNTGNDTLGQITAYAAAQLGSQFRTHAYSVLIVKDTARLFRWDRSGTIVTEAFKYNETHDLVEFFRRYSKASPEMRGKDQSVSDPTLAEATIARQALVLDNNTPLVKLAIPHIDGSSLYYIAPVPQVTPYTPPGRATRGFPAYDISRCMPVYMKDSWRVDMPDIWPEGAVYKVLKQHGVRNIPDCLSSGDISTDQYHASKTCRYLNEPWACHSEAHLRHFIPHRHYRLTLDVIGRSLTDFRTSYEMVSAVRDAIIGELLVRCTAKRKLNIHSF
jgi:Fungal protein kinase